MEKKFIIANWKMYLDIEEQIKEFKKINNFLRRNRLNKKQIVVCPDFLALTLIAKTIKNIKIELGSQNVFWEDKGAFTGEISPFFLKKLGIKYAIIGHSERRKYLKEDDEIIHKKIKACFLNNIIPILCIGETFEERQKGLKDYIILKQLTTALEGFKPSYYQKLIVAYEPRWVIGTGQAVEPEDAGYITEVIYQTLIDLFPNLWVKNNTAIIYGGSVNKENVKKFTSKNHISGVLVGYNSIIFKEFKEIILNA